MKNIFIVIFFLLEVSVISVAQDYAAKYPSAEIANNAVRMKLYTPDVQNGYYRGTRFDWSGIVYSLEYKGHQYFGEWRSKHDPMDSNDITGPVNGYLKPGLGYETAIAGEEFIRIGVGAIEKPAEVKYRDFETYKIIDNGKWTINKGVDWIEFTQELNVKNGWSYCYIKRIVLTSEKPGFEIQYSLKNIGSKTIETDQFNHNFFVIDKTTPGSDFSAEFRFDCKPDNDPKNSEEQNIYTQGKNVVFKNIITDNDAKLCLEGFSNNPNDNWFRVVNNKTKAGISAQSNTALSKLIFWAFDKPVCPEPFVEIKVEPGKLMNWKTTYTVFTIK